MSGAFFNPHALTGGAGYKANTTYDEFLHKHSGFYRKHSLSGRAMEEDRRASQIDPSAIDAANAATAEGEGARRGSLANATGGAVLANVRKGSVVVGSTAERRDSVFGLEASAGTTMDPNRRPSTSLASDLFHKMKGGSRKNSAEPQT